jgi:hypothetical protein
MRGTSKISVKRPLVKALLVLFVLASTCFAQSLSLSSPIFIYMLPALVLTVDFLPNEL